MTSVRLIPSIDRLLARRRLADAIARDGRARVVAALRRATAALRAEIGSTADAAIANEEAAAAWLEERTVRDLETGAAPSLRRVINATGVIVHTNLGRAPLAAAALARADEVAGGYSNLEYDLRAGHRGRREVHAERALCDLTGADAALVVNNNAGATLLVLAALAAGREVIVSRGELVEIGGGFRVPDVMAQSGASLREVGTTNRTRASDYAAAIGERTALILRVHPSNFRIDGFTERPALSELAALAHRFDLPLFEDLGSGWIGVDDLPAEAAAALRDEPAVRASLAEGADLVAFSGDKLLGGPQAGIVTGRADLITRARQHPLMRALRADKLTYGALEATLALWSRAPARDQIPVYRMLTLPAAAIDRRALALADQLTASAALTGRIIDGASTIGGGSAPGSQLPTRLLVVEIDGMTAAVLESRLRAGDPPIIARIHDGAVVLDLRTVDEADDVRLGEALTRLGGMANGEW